MNLVRPLRRICVRIFIIILPLILIVKMVNGLENTQAKSLFEEALIVSKNGELTNALSLWNSYLKLAPKDAAAYSNRGNIKLALGDREGAIADQTESININMENADPHLNRGIAEESLKQWEAAAADYIWILERNPNEASALYNLGNVRGSEGNWRQAKNLFEEASLANPGFAMARASKALAMYELDEKNLAEKELRDLIRRYPMMADTRAALSALLWSQHSLGEAESHWAAAAGLDSRYKDEEWLLIMRRWPPQPIKDLMAFLALERP